MARVITDYLDLVVKKYPDKLAVSLDKQELTFKGLQVISKKIATSIIKKGLKNNPIIILLDKSPKTIVSLMGVAYSGNYYTILPKKLVTPVSTDNKIHKNLSKNKLARRYIREKGIKDKSKAKLLKKILKEAEND